MRIHRSAGGTWNAFATQLEKSLREHGVAYFWLLIPSRLYQLPAEVRHLPTPWVRPHYDGARISHYTVQEPGKTPVMKLAPAEVMVFGTHQPRPLADSTLEAKLALEEAPQ